MIDLQVRDMDGVQRIQEMADNGTLIIMSYRNNEVGKSGHIALVGRSDLLLFSVPKVHLDTGDPLPQNVVNNDNKLFPILVQAGTFAGIVTMNWGTNGWRNKKEQTRLLEEDIRFYAVRSP
jgi:hypothetical protein